MRAIIEEASASPGDDEARKIGDLYASFMDEARIEELGAAPLAEDLALVDTVDSPTRLLEVLGHFGRAGIGGLFGLYVSSDLRTRSDLRRVVEQSGISLPNESYYRDEQFAEVRDGLPLPRRAHVGAGRRRATPTREPGGSSTSRPRSRATTGTTSPRASSDKTYNPLPWDGLRELLGSGATEGPRSSTSTSGPARSERPRERSTTSSFASRASCSELGELLGRRAPRRLARLAALAGRARVRALSLVGLRRRAVRLLRSHAFWRAAAPRALEARRLARRRRRWAKRSARSTSSQHFAPSAKSRMDELVANLIEAYRHSIAIARVDDAGDPGARAREARGLHAQDRLPRQVARLLGPRDDARRPDRQRARGERVRVQPPAGQDRLADRSRRSGS